jgi:phosphatidylglycerophosphatase C
MNIQRKTYAFFDFDGTITTKDTLVPFLYFSFPFVSFSLKMLSLIPYGLLYLFRIIDNSQMKTACLTRFLKGLSLGEIEQKAEEFALKELDKLVRPLAREKIQWHLAQGHHIFLISANLSLFLKYWAGKEQFEQVIASELEIDSEECFTGKLKGLNCYAEEKVRRLKPYLEKQKEIYSFAYGDSRGDKELLEFADEAFFRVF